MDYQYLIENNACLKKYFSEFPKKLKQLAIEGKVLQFIENGIEINPSKLSDYLHSKFSIFRVCDILDFFETLQVLQFSRSISQKNKSYIFINPNFQRHKEVTDDFYKQAIDITNVNELKGTKRMSPLHNISLFDRLIKLHNRQQIVLSKREYTQLRLRFLLQRQIDSMKYEENVIEYDNIDIPEYVTKKEIAGYYGNADLAMLKQVFVNYFPIYEEDADEIKEDQQICNDMNDPHDNANILAENDIAQSSAPDLLTPTMSNGTTDIVNEEFGENDKENEPPRKKRRKYINRSSKVTIMETNDALMNLQKEFDAFNSLE